MSLGSVMLRAGHHYPKVLPYLGYFITDVDRHGGEVRFRDASAQVVMNGKHYVFKRPSRDLIYVKRARKPGIIAKARLDLMEQALTSSTWADYRRIRRAIRTFVDAIAADAGA